MGIRIVATAALLAALAASLPAPAQSRSRPRIGFLSPSTPAATRPLVDEFRRGLRERGLVEGSTVTVDYRFAGERFDRLPQLAAELVRLRVDVLVAVVTQASWAAKQATSTIPIVMVGVGDPVAAGLVTSLARPGGNVTGNSSQAPDTAGKSLELLKDVVPDLRRVGVLWNPANRIFQRQMVRETEAAARAMNLQLQVEEANSSATVERALERLAAARVEALDVLPDPTLMQQAPRVAALAARARLASVGWENGYAEAGGLMAYGPSLRELHRRAAYYVARIIEGARPADLPIEQPTKFDFVINVKTARRLGLTLPTPLLLRADLTIE